MQTDTRTLPAAWASYLINRDASGLDAGEKEEIDNYLKGENLPAPASCSDNTWFQKRNDANTLAGEVMEFTFLL